MSSHRIALISDLHGNEIALREVLRSIRERGVDEIVCLGDVATLGVEPGSVVDMLLELRCRCVLGNHDEYLLDPALIREHTDAQMIIDAVDWCRDELPADHIEFVRGFESGFELPLGDRHTLKLFHGSPASNMVDLLTETPAGEFDCQLGIERAAVMAGGHTHVQMIRQHRGVLVVNPGSVGAPFSQFVGGSQGGSPTILDHAEYATVEARQGEVGVTLHRVRVDRHAMARAALASSNPMSEALAAPYL